MNEPYQYQLYVGMNDYYPIKDEIYDWVIEHRSACKWNGDHLLFKDSETTLAFRLKFENFVLHD